MPASSDNPTAREPGAFRTHIGSHDVAALASGRDTPFFVYDAAAIRQRIAELGAFDVGNVARASRPVRARMRLSRAPLPS